MTYAEGIVLSLGLWIGGRSVRFLSNPWLVAGGLLDLVGLGLVIWALPEGGWPLAAGVVCLLAGALAISRASLGLAPEEPAAGSPSRAHRIEPELASPPPRRVELKVRPKLVVGLWAMALGLMAFFFYDRVWTRLPPVPSQSLLANQGVAARGEVHRKELRESASGEPRYYLYYNFDDQQGSGMRASVSVPAAVYERFGEGAAITVVYLPGESALHYLPEITRDPFAMRGSLIAALLAAFAIGLLEMQRRKHKRLTSRGAAVEGKVAGLVRRGVNRVYTAEYRAGGKSLSVRATERNPARREGDAVTVLYNPNDPTEAIVYVAAMYRVV